jgi:hypothetical protein
MIIYIEWNFDDDDYSHKIIGIYKKKSKHILLCNIIEGDWNGILVQYNKIKAK